MSYRYDVYRDVSGGTLAAQLLVEFVFLPIMENNLVQHLNTPTPHIFNHITSPYFTDNSLAGKHQL